MTFPSAVVVGFFLGLAFGVGCALAVLYSIFMGGYRAAVRDAGLTVVPDRLHSVRVKLAKAQKG